MKIKSPSGLHIVMRAYQAGEEEVIASQISSWAVGCYIGVPGSQTVAQEAEWVQNIATDTSSVHWAICLADGKEDRIGRPIGTSSLTNINGRRAISGVVIYDRALWGKGVASACHRARCKYAQKVMGLCAIDSSVIRYNHASLKALRGVGYEIVGTHLAEQFVDGEWRHRDELTWVNPWPQEWQQFWGDTPIPKKFLKARDRATEALEQALREVTFL